MSVSTHDVWEGKRGVMMAYVGYCYEGICDAMEVATGAVISDTFQIIG